MSDDIVIIGGGLAGITTANRAAELGLNPILLEQGSDPQYFCNSRLAGGILHVAFKDLTASPDEIAVAVRAQTGEGEQGYSEETSEQVQRNLVKDLSLNGTTVKGTFLTREVPREFYAMVCAEPEVLKKVINQNKQLDGKAREFLNKRARAMKDKMDEMVEK